MINSRTLYTKAEYVAKKLNEDFDDVYDVLLGNITGMTQFVASVEATAHEYDELLAAGAAKAVLMGEA